MGLYKKICDNFLDSSTKVEPRFGLLAKAEMFLANEEIKPEISANVDVQTPIESEDLSSSPYPIKIDEPFVFFKNFCTEVGLQKVVVLIPHENTYKAIFSYGVESASREESISTFDFWNGTLKENQWYSFSGEDLCPFYQLFADNDVHLLKHLHIKRFEIAENVYSIILILEDSVNSFIDLETVEIILPNLKEYLLSFVEFSNDGILFKKNEDLSEIKDKVSSEIAKFNMGFLHSISLQPIFRELQDSVSFDDFYHIFSFIYHLVLSEKSENEIWYFTEELEIRNVNFAQTEFDLNEFTNKLNSKIKNIFSIENPELEIRYEGNSLEENEIFDFLFMES